MFLGPKAPVSLDTVHSRRVTVSHGEKNGHAVTRREGKSQKFDLDSTMVDSRPSSTKTHGVSTAWSRCITVSSRWVHGELTASHGEVHGAVTVHHGAPRCVHGEPRCLHGAFTVTTARSRWGSRCAHGELGSGIKASVSWDYPHLLLGHCTDHIENNSNKIFKFELNIKHCYHAAQEKVRDINKTCSYNKKTSKKGEGRNRGRGARGHCSESQCISKGTESSNCRSKWNNWNCWVLTRDEDEDQEDTICAQKHSYRWKGGSAFGVAKR